MPLAPASDDPLDFDPFDEIAEEYASLCRRGVAPSISEYEARHPEHAEQIRLLLPAVALLERGKKQGPLSGSGLSPWSGRWGLGGSPPIDRLGENRIIREIGRGGMGIVYEAIQEPLGRRVAVKILPRHLPADSTGRQRFLREAQAVAKLNHPHIVPLHAVGEEDGLPYYVMAFIDGQGLDHILASPSKAFPTEPVARARWVAELGIQAADALAHAHEQGVLHRDIKPGNLLLDVAGTLWLADFGLAKLVDDLSLTGTGDLPGTLRYLAPECLNDEADERSDIYSLGLTLFELVAGAPAFPETNRARLLNQVQTYQVPPLRGLVANLPRDLETIILKAMARDPESRYESARDLADDLHAFLDGRAIQARPVSSTERLVRWSRRNPVVAVLTVTAIVLALTTAYFLRLYLIAPPRFPPPPFTNQDPLDGPRPGGPGFRPRPGPDGLPPPFGRPPRPRAKRPE